MLLTRGVIRIGMPLPSGAEFTLVRADDPYRYASAQKSADLAAFLKAL